MTFTTLDSVQQPLEKFTEFDTDTKLALLWFQYLDLKQNLDNAPPANDVEALSNAVYDRVKVLSPEEQLQAQRDIVEQKDTPISREYGALSPAEALEFWLLLAQGMESGQIVNLPEDYSLPKQTYEFVEIIKKLDFEERIDFTRNVIASISFKPKV